MLYSVGQKGQIVVAKEIRERLGVEPGWVAIQRLVDDHVEVYFVPPAHKKSLKGALAKYVNISIPPGEAWEKARKRAWKEAAEEKVS